MTDEKKPSMFGGMAADALKGARATPPRGPATAVETPPAPTHSAVAPRTVQRRAPVAPRAATAGATNEVARRNNPVYTQMSAYVETSRYGEVRKQMIQHPRLKEMGALLDELFERWLREGAS
jgi:hypothetical protein